MGGKKIAVSASSDHDQASSDHDHDLLEPTLFEVEECVRYYPPDLAPVDDRAAVFHTEGRPVHREIDIFVDVPFCPTICGFCPFNVYTYDAQRVATYLEALGREVAAISSRYDFSAVSIRTVWIGGGTPSVLEGPAIESIFDLLHTHFDLSRTKELTVEIKPSRSGLAHGTLDLLSGLGVRRISMGLQSTLPQYLRMLGRGHTADEAFEVIHMIKERGFALNVDMMYRLPGQTLDEVLTDIEAVSGLGLDHLSWFPYVPHEGTTLAGRIDRGRLARQAGREEYVDMFVAVLDRMQDAGFEGYTPYHYGSTARCDYHVGRWGMPQRETLGLGPGAFAFFNGWIYANEHDPEQHAAIAAQGEPTVMVAKHLDRSELTTRLAVLGVKLFSLDKATFREHSGEDLDDYYRTELEFLEQAGLLEVDDESVRCTLAGKAFNNDVATVFATDTARRTRHPQATDLMRSRS